MYKEYFSNNPLRHHGANFRRPTSPFPTEQSLLSNLTFGLEETEQIPFQHPGPVQISGSHLFKSQAAGARKLTFNTCADPLSWIPNFIPAEGRLHPRLWSKEDDGIFHFPSTELQRSPLLSMLLLASSVTIKNTWFCFSGFKMCKWCTVYLSATFCGSVLSLLLTDVYECSSRLLVSRLCHILLQAHDTSALTLLNTHCCIWFLCICVKASCIPLLMGLLLNQRTWWECNRHCFLVV